MIEGGISKTRCATRLSPITSCDPGRANALPNQREQNRALFDAEQVNGDHYSFADSSVSSAAAGVAGRLVMYSQQLINSFGYVPTITTSDTETLIFFHCLVDYPAPIGRWSPITCSKHLLLRTNKQARA